MPSGSDGDRKRSLRQLVAQSVIQEIEQGNADFSNPMLAAVYLTPREIEIAELMEQGKTSKEIAREQWIELSTIDSHITHMYKKFGAKTRLDFIVKFPLWKAFSHPAKPSRRKKD